MMGIGEPNNLQWIAVAQDEHTWKTGRANSDVSSCTRVAIDLRSCSACIVLPLCHGGPSVKMKGRP